MQKRIKAIIQKVAEKHGISYAMAEAIWISRFKVMYEKVKSYQFDENSKEGDVPDFQITHIGTFRIFEKRLKAKIHAGMVKFTPEYAEKYKQLKAQKNANDSNKQG